MHVESWRTTYRGLVANDVLDNLSVERRAAYWASSLNDQETTTRTFIAEDTDTGEIVGFASAGPERDGHETYRSELYAIYLLEEAQGMGLGKLLTAAVVDALLDAGYESMMVWVLADNPARQFYRAIGGAEITSKRIQIGPDDLEEIALGWDDLAVLATRLHSSRS